MMRTVRILSLTICCLAANASAEWRVDIESKTVPAGATGVTVNVTASWDLPLAGFAVPVVVREIDPGSFWTGILPYDTAGSASYHPFVHGVQWNWSSPWATLIERVRPAPARDRPLWCIPPGDTLYDGVSPDQFVILAASGFSSAPAEPDGRVVVTLSFDVTHYPGDFEFDTACYSIPLSTISMTDNQTIEHGPIGLNEVTFNKGVITIVDQCNCDDQGDVNDDGFINPADVVYLIGYAVGGGAAPADDVYCPCLNRGDWDCNSVIDLRDMVKMVNYVYRQPASGPCDPCE